MSCHGTWEFDLIFVASVKRTRTTKNFASKLFKNEWQFKEVESFLLQEVFEQKLGHFLLAASWRTDALGLGLYLQAHNLLSNH